jgi:hypothetical protein
MALAPNGPVSPQNPPSDLIGPRPGWGSLGGKRCERPLLLGPPPGGSAPSWFRLRATRVETKESSALPAVFEVEHGRTCRC